MKKQLVLLLAVVGTFVATSASAQPYISAHIGIRFPQPRVFCAPPAPVVVYDQPVCDQPVVYDNGAYYDPGYNNRVVYENRRPVYYGENGYARPRYVEVNRYRDHGYNRGYRDDRRYDDRREGRRW